MIFKKTAQNYSNFGKQSNLLPIFDTFGHIVINGFAVGVNGASPENHESPIG